MSGTQSTVTDRYPKKATRTGSILSKDHPPDKKPKSDKPSVPASHEFDPTDPPLRRSEGVVSDRRPESCGLVQRCVIIQKDDNGFGLTVSGDNPVFVQLVKEDGAAMRAGVQTGDRIIKVNGTLVTHSNHVEVVKLIRSGSYVALTVLGRPPGLHQIPLSEGDVDAVLPDQEPPPVTSPQSPAFVHGERTCSPSDRRDTTITAPVPLWEENNIVHNQKVDILQKMLSKEQQDLQAMEEEYSRNPTRKLLKEMQEAKKHIPQLQGELSKATGGAQDGLPSPRPGDTLQWSETDEGALGDTDAVLSSRSDCTLDGSWTSISAQSVPPGLPSSYPDSPCQRETPTHSPKSTPRSSLNSCTSPEAENAPDLDGPCQSRVGSPSLRAAPLIIGAEDEDFTSEQEPMNGQCSCFQSIELLKSRPAHLAAFLHHVVSQFDPAPLLCYLYAELYKQTNSKETRRVFLDLCTSFMDRTANLKVAVPEFIATDLERRRPDMIPEDLHRQYVQSLQDSLLADIQRHLEDFRQKRNMGLTLAEGELTRLDTERVRSRVALERERSCAEQIISKIEDVLLTSLPTEEEKYNTMQYVMLSYMKHLGVRVKEPRSLESKRTRINFLPRIKVKSIKLDKEGDERVKPPRFPSILVPPRRISRTNGPPIIRVMELNKQRPQKQLSQPGSCPLEHQEGGRSRGSQTSEGSDATHVPVTTTSPPYSAPGGPVSEGSNRDWDSGSLPASALPRPSEGPQSSDSTDSTPHTPNTHFDFSPSCLEQLQEEERESDRVLEGGTPKTARRADPLSSADVHSEDDQGNEIEFEQDPPNWQQLVSREVLAGLTPPEIKRQEVINELFYTERAHLRMLKVLDSVFNQKLTRDAILPPAEIKSIFANLEEIIQLHGSIAEQMTAIRRNNETTAIDLIGDDLLSWFGGGEEEKIKRAVGTFCSNQPFALELIKTRQKKDQRFNSFILEAESNRLCRRLQLKDIIPVEMQRLTKYPLLLENIAKYTEDAEEMEKVKRAGECCRQILNYVNQAVKESENKQRLEDYQRRLDLSSLKQSESTLIAEFKNLDLTKRKMVHEGPLSWKVKDKTIELYTLLLEDILVLLPKQDEKLILKSHSKNLAGTSDTKRIFSPVIKLNTVLVRSVATDNKSFFVLSMSENRAQIYELMAQTVSEQQTWLCLITQQAESMKTKLPSVITLPSDGDREAVKMISAGGQKLSEDPNRNSTGSIQSPEKDVSSATPEIMQTPSVGSNPFEDIRTDEEEEEAEQDGEDVAFVDPELGDRLPADSDDDDPYPFGYRGSTAEEALKTLEALRKILLDHMIGQGVAEEGRQAWRDHRGRLLRTTSLRGPMDSPIAQVSAPLLSPENGAEKAEGERELTLGDTGFFETSDDYGSYMVLEGCGGSGESSTDDDAQAGERDPGSRWGPAGDSGIDLKKLLSSSSLSGGQPNFSRQVMTHLRLLQANLNQLKEVEAKYRRLCQKQAGAATDMYESKDS
ncbi:rho guanine nucleotide exchange factor 12-like isoform X2 [Brienomyrus brachyistius]|uniref:rho guanine nucleotide exchange factor 12-like isoform X2 n=1 Tax=Brienomyrus brachyistius TaxID=42636 RepID=UPI0020B39958|nr:rho guanine nucleotide exchange factor 12-like isoform X2 [Brienomyrus brachyistius]